MRFTIKLFYAHVISAMLAENAITAHLNHMRPEEFLPAVPHEHDETPLPGELL